MQQGKLFESDPFEPVEGSLSLKYDGEATAAHTIDVELYARSLLGFGRSFRRANRKLLGFEASMTVKAEESGSFKGIIDYVLTPEGQGQIGFILAVLGFMKLDAKEIGMLPVKLYKVLIHLIKKSQGKKAALRKAINKLELDEEAQTKLIKLLENSEFRRLLDEMTYFLEHPGMESLEISEEEVAKVRIHKSERAFFVAQPEDETVVELDEKIVSITYLSPENSKWQFRSGSTPFWAEVIDPIFLEKMRDKALEDISDLKFSAMVEKTTVKTAHTKQPKISRTINQFRTYDQPKQLKMF